MEYELIDAGPCRKKLLLKFTAEEIDKAFNESYKDINNYVRIKGFRKGKAPRRTLEKRFSSEAASSTRQTLADENIPDVIKKEDLLVLGDIISPNAAEMPAPGKDFTIDVEFNAAPEFDLPEYHGLTLNEKPVQVDDAKVEEAIERYRKVFANYEEIDEPAQVNDVLKVNFKTTVDGNEIMAMDNQRLRVEGDILFGLPAPDLVEKFTGAKKDDVVAVQVTLPEEHPNPELRGRQADVTVTVNGVERGALPELDDQFAANLGFGSMQNFREMIRSNLTREAVIAAKQEEEDDIINQLLAKVEYEVPQNMVDGEADLLVEQHRAFLLRNGAKPGPGIDAQVKGYREEAAKEALRKVRWTILSNRIAKKENLQVTNEDMAQQVEALAQNYNTTPAKIIERIRQMDGIAPMMAEILSMKVITLITDSAKGRGQDSASVNKAAMESVQQVTDISEEEAKQLEQDAKQGE